MRTTPLVANRGNLTLNFAFSEREIVDNREDTFDLAGSRPQPALAVSLPVMLRISGESCRVKTERLLPILFLDDNGTTAAAETAKQKRLSGFD